MALEKRPALTLRLFGPFDARVEGAPLRWHRKRKGEWLLALLALRAGREVERGWLAGTLWPASAEAQARTNLRVSLANLRRALGPAARFLFAPRPHTLALDLAGLTVDVLAFDAAVARADAAGLAEAVALYRGPLLESCGEEWVFQERQAREQAYLLARERLAALALERGDMADAEQHLRRAVAVDPLRERAQRALMQALAAGGNYAAALHCYRELRLHLHRELNTEPDAETQTLFQQLRSEGRRLAAKGAGVKGWAAPLPAHPFTPAPLHPLAPSLPELPAAVLREALSRAPVVGRAAELAALVRRLETAGEGRGSVCLLAGEPGIGKTRLATEAAALARQRGFLVLTGRCDEMAAAPYQPFVDALRQYLDRAPREQAEETLPPPVACELVRLSPRLTEKVQEVAQVAPVMGAAGRQALGEALGEFFALLTGRQSPVLLVLDDLHWADEGSLALLHHLARQAPELRLLIVGTYRDLPPDLRRPLEQTLAALNRERLAERLPLRRLPEAGVGQMVAGLLEVPFEQEHEQEHEHEDEHEHEQEQEATGDEGELVAGRTDGLGHAPPAPTPAPPPPPPPPARPRAPAPTPAPERPVPTAWIAALHQQTEGNPFFVEEVLQHLVEEGAFTRQDGRWQMALPAEFRVPPSVQAAIGRRLEHLSAESRETLTLASVIGPQFDFEVLLAASGVKEERLLEAGPETGI